MGLSIRFMGDSIACLLPAYNTDRHARAAAWNCWLLNGGADPVLKFIRWSNGTSTDDEEILQDTLITAYQKIEQGAYELRGVPFTAFLKQIARYKILEAARRGRNQVALDDASEHPLDDSDREQVEFWREFELLNEALASLPERRSRVLMLYENGYSTAEIAEALSIREDLVRKEKSIGLKQLRAMFDEAMIA